VTTRELNRTLLLRQMLLERKRISVANAVGRLLALQAQYAPSPYVALWSRVHGFRKDQLTRNDAIVKAATLRTTLHVMSRKEYPYIAAAQIEARRGRTENLGVDIDALRRALPARPLASTELDEIAKRVLGTEDRWTIAFALRALPFVRVGVVGPWPHTKPPPAALWREALPDPQTSATRVVRAFLAAYGPATRDEIERFTTFRVRQIAPALDGLPERDGLYDVPRAPRARGNVRAPVRFLPAYDSMVLAHLGNERIVPAEYVDAVYNRKNATCKNTFTVDGFVTGTWLLEKKRTLVVTPFLRMKRRQAVDVATEAASLANFLGADDVRL